MPNYAEQLISHAAQPGQPSREGNASRAVGTRPRSTSSCRGQRVGAASPAMALSAKKRAVIKIIKAEAKKSHLSNTQIAALLKIAKRESGYRAAAQNHSCKGLFQLKTSFGRSKWADAAWNTRRALRYIKHRYHTPTAALRHSNRYGWY